ncbi:MAG: epoxyqueuosine reductase [Clostridia bacterium]|nr:epoxyqueuosine reductase [Clostridia bacterium]
MKEGLTERMARAGIADYRAIPFSSCRVTFPELLSRTPELTPRSVLLYAVPYFTGDSENLSDYAAAEDYHLFFRDLSRELIEEIKLEYPGAGAVAYVDHSPIDERHAAAIAGLGIIGRHGLLIHPLYSSFVYIGEIVTDLDASLLPGAVEPSEPRFCKDCGACRRACPTGILSGKAGSDCLSAITQRKGDLTDAELDLMYRCKTVWGCDLCQLACPHTKRAISEKTIKTPIPFFQNNRTPHPTYREISEMPKDAFSRRAYAWRGRKTILRNLLAYEEREKADKNP